MSDIYAFPGRLPVPGPLRAVPLYPASVREIGGSRWGYIDERGQWRIPAAYETAEPFSESGVAVVSLRGKSGVIDASGRFVVPAKYDWIDTFSEGRATAFDERGALVIDERGRVLTENRTYEFISRYANGRALFSQTSGDAALYGYLDREGKEVIPARYLQGGDFSNGKAVVQTGENEFALIDPNGRRLASYPFAEVGQPGDGLLAFRRTADGPYGYIDETGHVAIEPRFAWAGPFRDGRAIVNGGQFTKPAYGVIDRTGAAVVAPQYNDAKLLGEGRAALGEAIDPARPYIGSKYAIADANDGRLLTGFRFYIVNDFSHGLASVADERETYFVTRDGTPAAGLPRFGGSGTLTLRGDLVQADVDRRTYYYNRRIGALVWAPNAVVPLTPPLAVRERKYKPNRDYLVYYPEVTGMHDTAAQDRANRRLRELSQVKEVPSGQLESSYTGDFEVTFYKDSLLVLKMDGYDYPWGAAHGMPTLVYALLNTENGRFYELKDLFAPGSDYVKRLSDIVGEQIRTDPQYDYVFPDSYRGIRPDQPFFVTEDALHLYFQPYEIAPYAAGFPMFRIPFAQIRDIIDTGGEFWRSFH